MEIPFFRYQHVFQGYRESLEHTILRVAEAGAFILQQELREFEERTASYCNVRFAVGVGNATDGLELILRVAGVGAGDEVLLPSHTFVASASPVVMAGAKPVFVEVGADHLMDPEDLEHRVTEHTRVIMPTQLNGRTADMDRIGAVAQRHGLKVLEDSAQGLGSRFCGRMAGTFGVAGVYRFYPAKILGCLGDGGVVVTNDEVVAEALRELRDHGRRGSTGEVVRWGRNTRLDNIQAAVLLAKLDKLDHEISRRRELAAQYHERLHDVPYLRLPPPPDGAPDVRHYDVFQNYEIEAENRDALRIFLAERGVGTILQWGGKGVHQFPALGLEQSLPRTEAVLVRSFLLPMNTSLADEELQYVCDRVVEFYDRR
jgi:dTDP-4-amino-4,6-dideoxygalactose transaminase